MHQHARRRWIVAAGLAALASLAATGQAADPPQVLRWKWAAGQAYTYDYGLETNAATVLGIHSTKVKAVTVGELSWEVQAAAGQLVQTIRRVRIRGEQDDTAFEIDTAAPPADPQPGPKEPLPRGTAPPDSKTPPKAAPPNESPPPKAAPPSARQPMPADKPPPPRDPQSFYRLVIGSQARLSVSPLGVVERTVLLPAPGADPDTAEPREKLHRQFAHHLAIPVFTAAAVRPGDAWQVARELEHPLVGKYPIKVQYRLDGMAVRHGKPMARLLITADLDDAYVAKSLAAGQVTEVKLVEHSLKGVAYFDPADGGYSESLLRFSLKLDGQLAGQGYAQHLLTLMTAKTRRGP